MDRARRRARGEPAVRFGIAYKLNAVVLLSVLALGGALGLFFVTEEGRTFRAARDQRVALLGAQLGQTLAHAVADHGWPHAVAMLQATPLDAEITYLRLTSLDGTLLASRRGSAARGAVSEFRIPVRSPVPGEPDVAGGGPAGAPGDEPPGLPIGTVAIGIDEAPLQLRRAQLIERTLAAVIAGALVAALTGVTLVRLILQRSLTPVFDGIRALGAGELSRRLPADPDLDEIGQVADAFNRMADRLSTTLVSKSELEQTVAQRTRELTTALGEVRTTQATLEEREARIRLLLDSTAEAIYGIDRDGLCTFCNRTVARLLGYRSPEELLGRNMHRLAHHSTAEGATVDERDCRIYRTLRDGEAYHADDELFWRADGTQLPVEVWSFPMHREGELVGSVVTFLDVSERKRLEAELLTIRKLESLGVLAGGIAHDFNNLLMGILGNISLAKEEQTAPGERRTLLAEAEQAALRARNLTQQLLAFSKGGAPVKRSVALRELVEDAARFALSGAAARAVYTFSGDLWPVEADAGQLGQVVHNLILNAVQAMPTGGTIDVACHNVALGDGEVLPLPAGHYVRLTVADEGHGISPEHLHRIFDPYFTTKAGGHGLGLASVYSVVQRHGGRVTVESTLGKGTRFTIHLPASDRPAEPKAAAREPRAEQSGRVLVMDDEPSVRKVATVMLARLGFAVDTASDGGEALEKVREAREAGRPFDVLLMDLTVPGGMGGVEAAERLPLVDPEAVAVATSGYSNDPVMSRCTDFGFVAVVAKPYTPADLGLAIALAMEARRRRRPAPG